MTDETEIPEICKKYDELSQAIQKIESDKEELENQIQPRTETIKEYLQILKDTTDIGIGLTYYKKRINEMNDDLLQNDSRIDEYINQLSIKYKEQDALLLEINKIKWWKIDYIWSKPKWHPENEAIEILKRTVGSRRLV